MKVSTLESNERKEERGVGFGRSLREKI